MTQTSTTEKSIADVANELAEIGEEFGCAREPSETNEEYGLRIIGYLDEMVEELHKSQDRVHELIS